MTSTPLIKKEMQIPPAMKYHFPFQVSKENPNRLGDCIATQTLSVLTFVTRLKLSRGGSNNVNQNP